MIGSAAALARWIETHDDIAVIVHFRPDGDAYGSALALTAAIRALGKRAFPACDDPVEPKYRFLPGWEDFATAETLPFQPKAALGADVSDRARMGKLADVFDACPEHAVIDHHDTNEGFGEVCYVDENAASTGEIALGVIEELGLVLTPAMAVSLYTAISTDSGNFSFQSTSPDTLRAAAECLEAGVDVENVTRLLYRSRTLGKTRLIGRALSKIEMFADGRVAAIRLTKDMFRETGTASPDAHGIVNYLNEIEGVFIGILAEEQDSGTKFSLRAANGANVAQLAQKFGGGGHVAAAGISMNDEALDAAFDKVIAAAEAYAREL